MQRTLIIGIYLHGEYHLNEFGSIKTDEIPSGMRVKMIRSAPAGVAEVSSLETKENIAIKISETIQSKRNNDKLTNEEIDNLTIELRDLLVSENKTQSEEIINLHHYQYCRNKVTPVLQNYTHQYDNAFKIISYEDGDTIPNKIFTRFSEGELINPDNIESYYVNKIIIYNLEGEPDLFDILKSLNIDLDIQTISLGQLLTFFNALGVENLIIVDASCSVIKGDCANTYDRNIRQIRRQMFNTSI